MLTIARQSTRVRARITHIAYGRGNRGCAMIDLARRHSSRGSCREIVRFKCRPSKPCCRRWLSSTIIGFGSFSILQGRLQEVTTAHATNRTFKCLPWGGRLKRTPPLFCLEGEAGRLVGVARGPCCA
jgi:hypothetical protein